MLTINWRKFLIEFICYTFSLTIFCKLFHYYWKKNLPLADPKHLPWFYSKPGMYYFQTETHQQTELSNCIVHVRERQREYNIAVQDTQFSPPIIVIEEGDRIWWHWNKDKVGIFVSILSVLCIKFLS